MAKNPFEVTYFAKNHCLPVSLNKTIKIDGLIGVACLAVSFKSNVVAIH